jgi:hypothetical protein
MTAVLDRPSINNKPPKRTDMQELYADSLNISHNNTLSVPSQYWPTMGGTKQQLQVSPTTLIFSGYFQGDHANSNSFNAMQGM